jgi:hypothetical protein
MQEGYRTGFSMVLPCSICEGAVHLHSGKFGCANILLLLLYGLQAVSSTRVLTYGNPAVTACRLLLVLALVTCGSTACNLQSRLRIQNSATYAFFCS